MFLQNETAVMSELVSRGPLSIAINAMVLQFYHSGVWHPLLSCNPNDLDHAVLLVGYGTETHLLSKKPYWLIKNRYDVTDMMGIREVSLARLSSFAD